MQEWNFFLYKINICIIRYLYDLSIFVLAEELLVLLFLYSCAVSCHLVVKVYLEHICGQIRLNIWW